MHCHSTCEEYLDYQDKNNAFLMERYKEKEIRNTLFDGRARINKVMQQSKPGSKARKHKDDYKRRMS